MLPVPDPSKRKRATIGILVGLLLAALDGTVVATALPAILDDLKGFEIAYLPVALFMLVQTVSMPIWGRLSDIYGRARFHLLAIALLIAGSILCGLTKTFGKGMVTLSVFRMIQALGAGGIMSLSFTMIGDLFDLEERAKMQGAISSVWGLAALIGPILGSWMTKKFDWPSIFYLNVPVGVASAILVQSSWEERPRGATARVDAVGALLLALASVSLLASVNLAKDLKWAEATGGFAVTLVFALLLVAIERRRADPFIAYDLYKSRLFSTGAATGVCAMLCLFASIFYVPILVAGVIGKGLDVGGMMLACMMLPWMICSALTKPLLKSFGYRTLAIVGMLFACAAYGILSRLDSAATLGAVIGAMVVLGTGLGLTVAPLLIAAQNAVTKDRLGAATSLTQFTRSMGAAVGITVMGALFATAFGGKEPEGIIRMRTHLDPSQLRNMVGQLVVGLHHVFLTGIVVAALGVVLALAIPSGKAAELKVPQPAEG